MMPGRSMDALHQLAGSTSHCSLSGSFQPAFAHDRRQGSNKVFLRLTTRSASVMKPAEAAKGDCPLRRIVDNHGMNEAGDSLVHVFEALQRAVPFADEDTFIALVAVCGDHRYEDVTAGNVLFDDRPPRVTGLEARFIKPHIQSRVSERGLQPLDRFFILARVANENRWRL